MAKRNKKHYKKPGVKIPLMTVVGALPGLSNVKRAWDSKEFGDTGFKSASVEATRIYFGLDSRIGANPKTNFGWTKEGTVPLLLGIIASKVASRLGVNKMFKGLPVRL